MHILINKSLTSSSCSLCKFTRIEQALRASSLIRELKNFQASTILCMLSVHGPDSFFVYVGRTPVSADVNTVRKLFRIITLLFETFDILLYNLQSVFLSSRTISHLDSSSKGNRKVKTLHLLCFLERNLWRDCWILMSYWVYLISKYHGRNYP